MVAPYFLPRRRVGALRPFKFAIHLKEFGWEPQILTIASNGHLTEKEEKLLKDISVYSLKPPFDRTNRSGSQLRSKNSNSKNAFSIGDWIDKHFPVDTWLPFFQLKLGEIKHIVNQVKPDAIWSTGDPWSAHWVGKKIANITPGIFWMADFRDPWTLSETDLKKRSSFASALDRQIERNWIQKMSMLSFTSNSTRELYESYYSDFNLNTATIYNSFDRELFLDMNAQTPDLKMNPEKVNLIFFGRFRRLSTAKPVIDILSKLKEKKSLATDRISVHSFGPLSDPDRKYAESKDVAGCFVTQDPVPVEEGLQVLKQADILLLSTNAERKDIIPAKLWDYLAAEQPILSIAPNPEIEQILQETGTGVQYHQKNLDGIANLLEQCILAKEGGEAMPIPFSENHQEIERYSARSATGKLANILDQQTR